MTDERRGHTRFAVTISNRQFLVRLEFAVTSTKQSLPISSNRHIWGTPASLSRALHLAAIAKQKFLTATRLNSKTRANP